MIPPVETPPPVTQAEGLAPDVTDPAPTEPTEPTEPIAPPPSAEVTLETVYLSVGESYTLPFSANADGITATDLSWVSSHDCVTVENGIVTAVKEGFSFVSAGGETSCHVRVLPQTLPTLAVNTNGEAIDSKELYTACSVSVKSESGDFDMEDVGGGIRLRGNSTVNFKKKPYRIKFNSKQNLLGLHGGEKFKSWVLLAEWVDDSLLRNATCLSLASLFLTEYSSDWCYVNLTVNDVYMGVFLLCEQSQINEGRVDIEEAGADSASLYSGYLFELEGGNPPEDRPYIRYDYFDLPLFFDEERVHSHPSTNKGGHGNLYFEFKNDDLSDEQVEFATTYLQSIFRVVASATYRGVYFSINPTTGQLEVSNKYKSAEEAISAVVDLESVARMYLLSELVCNNDEHYKSFYFYIDLSEGGTGKLTFACPWDFDGATVVWNTDIWQPTDRYFAAERHVWYAVFMNNDFFRQMVKELWLEYYEKTNGFANVFSLLSKVSTLYASDFKREETLWDRDTPQAELAAATFDWFTLRLAWIHEQFSAF